MRRSKVFMKLRKAIVALGTDASGISAIEFAGLLVFFMMIVGEILQLGLYFYTSASLNYATNKAVRQILIGAVANQNLTAAQFRTQILCPLLPGAMSCANVITNVQTVTEGTNPNGFYSFVNAAQTSLIVPSMNNNLTSFCIGTGGSYVIVQVFYAMPVLGLSWLLANATTWNGSSVYFVSANSAFRSEPFQTTYSGC